MVAWLGKEKITTDNDIIRKRRFFANTRAWRQGRGVLFADFRATLNGDRPIFANLRAFIGSLLHRLSQAFTSSDDAANNNQAKV